MRHGFFAALLLGTAFSAKELGLFGMTLLTTVIVVVYVIGENHG